MTSMMMTRTRKKAVGVVRTSPLRRISMKKILMRRKTSDCENEQFSFFFSFPTNIFGVFYFCFCFTLSLSQTLKTLSKLSK